MKEKYLTLQELAKELKLPIGYLYRMSHEGRLPGKIKLGRRTVRIDREVFEEALKEMKKKT